LEAIEKPHLLVVGGAGFIGSHLLTAAKEDWQVTSISLNPPSPQRFVSSVRYIQLDLTDFDALQATLVEDYDYVVNLGGYIDHTLFRDGGHILIDTHFRALQNLISTLSRKSLKRFVHIGSSDEYGSLPAPQSEELREQPISPYSLAKVASTHFLQMLHSTEGFPGVVLRLFLTYGPHQDKRRFLPQIIQACLRDEEFAASGGNQLRDFCYVQDVVRAILLALRTKDIEGHVFNIASGHPVSIRSIIESVQEILGRGKPQYGVIPYRTGENMALYASIQKAEKFLSWAPEIAFETGLKKTIEDIDG
jgi:nucleoside-diphosphate-sugar epimerase